MVEGEVKEKVVPTAPEPIVEPVVEPLPEPEPIVSLELDEDDREPGGSSPQEVRARKEYRSRKRVEASLAHEREARIAAEARTQALLEQRSKPSTAETPRYTTAQLQEAVDMGKISPIEAADYLAKVNFEEMAAKVLQTERSRIDRENHESQASSILQQYIAEVPWVADKTDPRYSRLEAEYATLTDPNGLYRLPRTMATDVLVLERVVGSLSRIQKAKSILMKTDSHVESGAGGVGTRGPTKEAQAQTLDKMPAHFHAYWDQTNTSQAEREKEAALYWKRQQTRAMNQ